MIEKKPKVLQKEKVRLLNWLKPRKQLVEEDETIDHTDMTYEKSVKANNGKIDMFIGAYKEFEPPVSNEAYKIIVGNHNIKIDTNLEIIKCGNKDDVLDDRFYSEQYMLKWLVDNDYKFKKYVGFCHYRKYFSFMDNIPDLDDVFKKFDCIISRPMQLSKSVREQYGSVHNIEDIEIIENIIKNKYLDYYDTCEKFLDNKLIIPCEMYIMKRDDFIECVNFVNGVLAEYIKVVGTDIKGRIENNKDKYIKETPPNDDADYQYRIGGYLAERLTSIFLMHKYKRMKTYPIKVTESKYINEPRTNKKKGEFIKSMLRIDDGIIVESIEPDGKTKVKVYDRSEIIYNGSFSDLIKVIKQGINNNEK